MKKPQQSFTADDALSNRATDVRFAQIVAAKIRNGDVRRGYEFQSLAAKYEYIGLSDIRLGQYGQAIGYFGAAAACWTRILERQLKGDDIAQDLLAFASNAFFLGVASGDDSVISRLFRAYGSIFSSDTGSITTRIDLAIGALTVRDVERASQLLSGAPTGCSQIEVEEHFFYNAIVHHDEDAFLLGIDRSVTSWRERIRTERLYRYPDAVCDHYTFGRIRLAERVWQKELHLEVGNIPQELYSIHPDPIDVGI